MLKKKLKEYNFLIRSDDKSTPDKVYNIKIRVKGNTIGDCQCECTSYKFQKNPLLKNLCKHIVYCVRKQERKLKDPTPKNLEELNEINAIWNTTQLKLAYDSYAKLEKKAALIKTAINLIIKNEMMDQLKAIRNAMTKTLESNESSNFDYKLDLDGIKEKLEEV